MYTHIYIYISSNWFRIACTYRYTKLNLGRGMVGPTLSNEIFKSDNPTEPPSHEPSFHSVISSLPRSGYPGGRGKYRVRRAPIDRPNRIKGNIEDFANLSLLAISSRDVSLATSTRRTYGSFFSSSFFATKREGSGMMGGFCALEKFATVIDGGHNRDGIWRVFLYLIWCVRCSIRCYLLFVVFGEIFGFFLKFVHRVSLLYL